MKNLFKLLLVTLALASCVAKVSQLNHTNYHHMFLTDHTDSMTSANSSQVLASLNQVDLEKDGVEIEVQGISEIGIDKVYRMNLAPVISRLLSNDYQRRTQEIPRFKSELQSALATMEQSRKTPQDRTVLFSPLLSMLEKASASKADKRRLYIYSDLMHNDALSFYHESTMKKLEDQSNWEELQNIAFQGKPLPDLSGVEIYVVHRPESPEKARVFGKVSAFLTWVLESRGARVYIRASL